MRHEQDSIVIASFCPVELPTIERTSSETHTQGGLARYSLKPYSVADRDRKKAPNICRVYDSFQAVIDPQTREHGAFVTVTATDRARDLVLHWTQSHRDAPSGTGWAIWVTDGDKIPPFDSEECKAQLQKQYAYLEWFYHSALSLEQDKKLHLVGEPHREAAIWLGREEAWTKPALIDALQSCPLCTTMIKSSAVYCPVCRQQIKELPPEIAKLGKRVA